MRLDLIEQLDRAVHRLHRGAAHQLGAGGRVHAPNLVLDAAQALDQRRQILARLAQQRERRLNILAVQQAVGGLAPGAYMLIERGHKRLRLLGAGLHQRGSLG